MFSAKDGCSPQGQCGCCTVLVDGAPRVACVTPVRRVAGREVTTLDGLAEADRRKWSEALLATGGSQCGFCTPGIIVRLAALDAKLTDGTTTTETPVGIADEERRAVDQALLAHLCRCTGWQTIVEAWEVVRSSTPAVSSGRNMTAAAERAEIEGGAGQRVGADVALGQGSFAADTAPADSLVAVLAADGEWVVAERLDQARAAAGKIQGRRTTAGVTWPLDVPEGDWAATLRTTWVEPGYLETDASWCTPTGEPSSPVANGGAFGAKATSPAAAAARRLAREHGRPVLALASREDVVRWGPKRPPVAGGAMADGSGALRVAATAGIADAIAAIAPALRVEEVPLVGPPTSAGIRAAGWAEALVLLAGAAGDASPTVVGPSSAVASATIVDGVIDVRVRCGDPLDEVVLRSYCIGAAHMGWSWVTSESLSVAVDGSVGDLTIRSFGIARAVDTPPIRVTIEPDDGPPVNGSDAVFAAVAAATWVAAGCGQDWPVGRDALVSARPSEHEERT